MGERVAIIAALPRELALLIRGWSAQREHHHRGIFVWTRSNTVAVAAGMGETRATLAVEAALAHGDVTELWSVGVAGACDPALAVGSAHHVGTVIDARTGERFATVDGAGAVLVTTNMVASVREKARLHASYHAAMVDMEAATVARLAGARGLAFRAFKAVSDDHLFELGNMSRFTTRHGHFHTRAFALHTAVRPHTWARTMRLGRHSQLAVRALTAMVENELGTRVR
jgi:adenosylhomocysteine nucleosidase